MVPTRVTFLIVDDDEVSVMAVRRALARQGIENPVVEARDGLEALTILRDQLRRPYVVLLDINMPRMNGLELLAELRDDPGLLDTVVFILTTSDAPQDLAQAYAHNVAGYILKEDAYKSIAEAVSLLDLYTGTVVLPSDQNAGLR